MICISECLFRVSNIEITKIIGQKDKDTELNCEDLFFECTFVIIKSVRTAYEIYTPHQREDEDLEVLEGTPSVRIELRQNKRAFSYWMENVKFISIIVNKYDLFVLEKIKVEILRVIRYELMSPRCANRDRPWHHFKKRNASLIFKFISSRLKVSSPC